MIGKAAKGVRKAASGSTLAAPPKGRGSFEGYMHGAATHIQMNGTGYASKAQQKARRPKQAANLRITKSNQLPMSSLGGTNILDMRRKGMAGSSVERLNQQMRLDKVL